MPILELPINFPPEAVIENSSLLPDSLKQYSNSRKSKVTYEGVSNCSFN